MIYNLYIFNPVGQCLYYGEWERTKETDMSQDEVSFILNKDSF